MMLRKILECFYSQTFSLVGSENFNEPLQAIEKSKDGIYVGTKSGSIFRLKKDVRS